MQTVIVFSHLRWGFVYQRPQHLLSRLAQHYRIVFIEEPRFQPGDATLDISTPAPNLTVCTPVTPVNANGFDDAHLPYLRPLVREIAEEFEDPIVWMYTPMAMPLLKELEPGLVVYDCMDELSAFHNPPPLLLEREDALLKRADIVFTGGASLYKAKRHRNPNVHCFPSSVDVEHFRQALGAVAEHPSQHAIPHPRLGFYGVIDERLDTKLIAEVADARPDWHIVLVGPVAKIDPSSLPQRPNIHYPGQQAYDALPQFLAAWDVCLMPFAMNESTRYISPTKSLEYMAAELPIVSTPVKDVVDLHSDVVAIASNAQEFIAACAHALEMPEKQMQERIRRMRDKLSRTSWDSTVTQMRTLLQEMDTSAESVSETYLPPLAASRKTSQTAKLRG